MHSIGEQRTQTWRQWIKHRDRSAARRLADGTRARFGVMIVAALSVALVMSIGNVQRGHGDGGYAVRTRGVERNPKRERDKQQSCEERPYATHANISKAFPNGKVKHHIN